MIVDDDVKKGEDWFEIEEMETENTSFSVDQHGFQCGGLQYLRELTQNAIEGIQEKGGEGKIFWTFDREELEKTGAHKLQIIDTGVSMNGEEIRHLMNGMYSSGKTQDRRANYGIGAKVSGLFRSPEGMTYRCFKDGRGYLAELCKRLADGKYGLRQLQEADGSVSPYLEIGLEHRPKQIEDSGTAVTLLGQSEHEDTFTNPEEGEYGVHWVSRYLNGRYFSIPSGIEIKASYRLNPGMEWDPRYKRRSIKGIKHFLDLYQVASGIVDLNGARMHWWVLDDDAANSSHFNGNSHSGSLFQNEIYDLETGNKSNRARLNRCGIIHLANRVVVYAEPTSEEVSSDPSRSFLNISQGMRVPWIDWADEFFEKMPPELIALESEASEKATDDDVNEALNILLMEYLKDLEIPKFAEDFTGQIEISPPIDIGGSSESEELSEDENDNPELPSSPSGGKGNRYSDFRMDDGTKGREATPSEMIPKVEWVSPEDHPLLEDRAAQFIRTKNRVLINKDFRWFRKIIRDVLDEKGGGKPGAEAVVEKHSKIRYAYRLCETILCTQMLKKGGITWKQGAVDSALNEEGLTAAVMGCTDLRRVIGNAVGHEIGRAIRKTAD